MAYDKAIVEVRGLTAGYGQGDVIRDVSFDVYEGDYVGLAGPNGAGKSTLVKVLLGLFPPYSGSISMFGTDISRFRDWGLVGYLPQRVNTYNPLFPASVREVISLGLLSRKSFPKSIGGNDLKDVDEIIEKLGISNLAGNTLGELSGGQQQKVFLARALVSKPKLLILDEPSTALDPVSRDSFYSMVEALNEKDRITIIMITHDTGNIGEYAKKLMYLDGQIVFFGSFEEFCGSEKMKEYFGGFYQHIICHRHR